VLESRKARVEAWLDEVEGDLKLLAAGFCAKSGCEELRGPVPAQLGDAQALLKNVLEHHPAYETIALYTTEWKRLAQTARGEGSAEYAVPKEFKTVLKPGKRLVMASPYPLGEDGVGIHAGYPVFGRDEVKVGYIVASLNVSRALDPILRARAGLGETGKAYLLSLNGDYVSGPPELSNLVARGSSLDSEGLSPGSSTIGEHVDFRGVKVIGARALIPDLNWAMAVEIDQEEAFAWLGILRIRASVTGAVTLVLVLLLAWKGSDRLSRPWRDLAAVSRRIAEGHHEERLGALPGAEAQDVGTAFNKMLDELAASYRRLSHAASLASVGELSSSVVHEMRNPLSSIKMNLRALREKVQGDAAYRELADIASNQVERLEHMLSDLLGYGKPLHLELTGVRFGDVARDVVDVMRPEAEKRAVSIRVQDHLEDTELKTDREQMRRALTNLVANAVQAAKLNGTVLVTGRIDAQAPERVAISVSDDGPGLSEAQMDKLFQPFFTTRDGGIGLGLANVKKIVDYHGGTVSAENRPEGGAVFTIYLPLKGPPA
jgi:signal transduction histidine kinase